MELLNKPSVGCWFCFQPFSQQPKCGQQRIARNVDRCPLFQYLRHTRKAMIPCGRSVSLIDIVKRANLSLAAKEKQITRRSLVVVSRVFVLCSCFSFRFSSIAILLLWSAFVAFVFVELVVIGIYSVAVIFFLGCSAPNHPSSVLCECDF